jgi:hypothetical protein
MIAKIIKPAASLSALLLLAACAGNGNSSLSIGIGSFGGSGGIGGSVTTDLPTGGTSNETPLPFAQIYLSDPVVDELFPDEVIPFTAKDAQVEAIQSYAANAEPAFSAETLGRLKQCQDKQATCRVQRQE